MPYNGPAIWGGCVTRRSIRAPRVLGAGTLATKLSRCKEGMARVFAVLVQILLSITRVAVQILCERYISHHAECLCAAEARSGFVPGYKAVLGAGAKAKLVTNLLILLSVLAFRAIFKAVKMKRICHDN
jgi:hypothetical protein